MEPIFNLDEVPPMRIGMGEYAAFQNGYKHGYQQVNTDNICSLTNGTAEREAWMLGYKSGDRDANAPDLSERDKLTIYAALNYAQCNVDDVNDAFQPDDDDEEEDSEDGFEGNIDGKINVSGKEYDSLTADDFMGPLGEFQPK